MSFDDIDASSPKKYYNSTSPRFCGNEEVQYEVSIKTSIEEIQNSVRLACAQLNLEQSRCASALQADDVDKLLDRCQKLSEDTEQRFKEWGLHLAENSSERHRKKFIYEKLRKAFEEEVVHVKEVTRKAMAAWQDATNAVLAHSVERSIPHEELSDGDDQEGGASSSAASVTSMQDRDDDITLRNRIVQDREESIQRIQGQVADVNQVFRDLASIVSEQGKQMESIEGMAEQSVVTATKTTQELRKAVEKSHETRDRLCCIVTTALLLICLVVMPHMHFAFPGLDSITGDVVSKRKGGNFSVVALRREETWHEVPPPRPSATTSLLEAANTSVATPSASQSAHADANAAEPSLSRKRRGQAPMGDLAQMVISKSGEPLE